MAVHFLFIEEEAIVVEKVELAVSDSFEEQIHVLSDASCNSRYFIFSQTYEQMEFFWLYLTVIVAAWTVSRSIGWMKCAKAGAFRILVLPQSKFSSQLRTKEELGSLGPLSVLTELPIQ